MTREIEELAENFWRAAGKKEPYPRSLENAVGWALPLAIVKVPRLGVGVVRDWLTRRGIIGICEQPDRALRACLIARFGYGIVFIDATDPDDERRFSLAHEVAHFILDYLQPRRIVIRTFGESIVDVLDGIRKPTPEERLSGVLRGVVIGPYTSLMGRASDNVIEDIVTLDSETSADRLALELLAPQTAVYARLRHAGLDFGSKTAPDDVMTLLTTHFGLPKPIARVYGTIMVYRRRSSASFSEWLGIQPGCRTLRRRPE